MKRIRDFLLKDEIESDDISYEFIEGIILFLLKK